MSNPTVRWFLFVIAWVLFPSRALVRAADINEGWIEVRSAHFTVITNGSEKDGRRIADQFEHFRGMFHSAFPTLRLDTAQPIVIMAAKNEGTMKVLVPQDWETKGHVHHAGLYQAGEDKDYVLLQLDAQGYNPFHVVYHEYTHALVRLNFSGLPLWLDEGLAEFFGNTTLGEKESRTGTIDSNTLAFLQQNRLIPVETLLQVDHTSPYYNEANRTSMFYAESWVVAHYLMMNPEARQRQLLSKFIAAWDKNQNQVQAAQEVFGDLKLFGKVIDGYSRQNSFMEGVVKMGQGDADKSYPARRLTAAEAMALRGDFFAHGNRIDAAKPVLEEAVRLDPNLAAAREALGFCYYRQQEIAKADAEIKEAIAHGDGGFAPAYFHGMLLARQGISSETSAEAIASLKKATQLNPQFAPAFETLAYVYSQSPDTQKEALTAGFAAVRFDPSQHNYIFRLIDLLLNNDRDVDARYLAKKMEANANSPAEKQEAESALHRVEEHEKWVAQRKEQQATWAAQAASANRQGVTNLTAMQPGASIGKGPQGGSTATPVPIKSTTIMAMEGKVQGVTCEKSAEVTLTLEFSGSALTLHSANLEQAEVTAAKGQTAMGTGNCQEWIGRKVKVWFHLNQGQSPETFGEITKLYFF